MKLRIACLTAISLAATSAAFGQTITETYDFSDASQIANWSPFTGPGQGTAVVDAGYLKLGANLGCCGNSAIELPINPDINRLAGPIKITAVVRVFDDRSDFDILALYAAGDPGLPFYPQDNGYFFSYRPPAGDDFAGVRVWSRTNNEEMGVATFVNPPDFGLIGWSGISAEITSGNLVEATLTNTLGNESSVQLFDTDHKTGKIALRSWGQVWVDNLTITYSLTQTDSDGDGIRNIDDTCPGTAQGSVVNGSGCSGAQAVALVCPVSGEGADYRNHGQYVSCVSKAASSAVSSGLLTKKAADSIVSAAGQSAIGKPASAGKKK